MEQNLNLNLNPYSKNNQKFQQDSIVKADDVIYFIRYLI